MSEYHSHDHEHTSFIKTPQQLIVVVVLAFVVPVLLIALIASLAFRSMDPASLAKSDEAIAKRLKPVGEVVIAEGPVPPEAMAATPAVTAPGPGAPGAATPVAPAVPVAAGATTIAAAGGAAKGKAIFDSSCAACHATGVAGAPKLGDKAAWAARMKQGVDAMHAAAMKGKGAMPPKGGNMALTDADIKAAVDFILAQVK